MALKAGRAAPGSDRARRADRQRRTGKRLDRNQPTPPGHHPFPTPVFIPMAGREGALTPLNPGALLDGAEADVVMLLHRLEPPFEALPAAQQWPEIDQ